MGTSATLNPVVRAKLDDAYRLVLRATDASTEPVRHAIITEAIEALQAAREETQSVRQDM